ncbi:SPOR domain-containing protein [Pacificibacter marinus]|uniref:Sporulation related domain protein n=1 Tax=Pacificibacter marinus TaxID=658057 RepID=A0A1Y5RFP3_9RHOB|nr:SPOR domain-containing protein [Pacificibacter marinus]SEK24553.1 Sporulation related domain-containing protein [Pacificibacter marinus]SLN13799.1 Sporulation related domain protein [Pacificibacter marinus]
MPTVKTISVAALVAMLSISSVSAKTSMRDASAPAEFPPVTYKAAQYVDSEGCAYVRTGGYGSVTWVPRVSRDRKVLCGFKPSLVQAQTKLPVTPDPILPAQTNAPLDTVASITATPAKVVPKSVPSKPLQGNGPTLADAEIVGQTCGTGVAGRSVRCTPTSTQPADYILKRLPAGITVRKADGGILTTTEPTLVRVAIKPSRTASAVVTPPTQIAPRSVVDQAAGVANCTGLSPNTAQYMATSNRFVVRCGPQVEHPSAYIQRQNQRAAQANTTISQTMQTGRELGVAYIAPKQVRTPKGYTRTFDDGRLNPNRGPRTLTGDYQQAQIWTNTVPAYAVDQKPHLTFWQKLFGSHPQTRAAVPVAVQANVPARVSTKSVTPVSTPVVSQTAPAQGLRYVQVGTFGVPANADKSIARLSSLGLPVSAQMMRNNGKPLKMVLAGPFATSQQTMQALAQARSAGYGDAFARK